ncbi:MAG TPA: hypothetical protein VD905_11135 [Flavobacteriales bacterium]|nr:hypothetical protein [Flavobacteriales bacterium]
MITPESAEKINVPVTIMLGELDKMVTTQESVTIQEKIPGSRFRLINGFVHPFEKLDMVQLSEHIGRL